MSEAVDYENQENGHFSLGSSQREAILRELERITRSPYFRQSERSKQFLSYVVQCQLAGQEDTLKERTIGIDVYKRASGYATGDDPVVRVQAGEVRRRLSQFYETQINTPEVRIELPLGRYSPRFHWKPAENQPQKTAETEVVDPGNGGSPELNGSSDESQLHPTPVEIAPVNPPIPVAEHRRWMLWPFLLAAAVALAAIVGFLWIKPYSVIPTPSSALEQFWLPVAGNHKPVVLCMGHGLAYYLSPKLQAAVEKNADAVQISRDDITAVPDSDATAGNIQGVLRIMKLLDTHGVQNELKWPPEVGEIELNTVNAVYIGAFNNPWTMRLNLGLRFTLERIDDKTFHSIWMIKDQLQPGRVWSSTKAYPRNEDYDFALITRVFDPERKRVVIAFGGLNQFGTQAAGEFLADPAAWDELSRKLPKDWQKKNLQIVLEVDVVGRHAVNPRVVATNVW